MKILILGTLILLFSCDSKEKEFPTIKKERFKEYLNTNSEKDSLILEYEIGNNPDGNQKYFVGILGYNNQDTTWTNSKSNYTKKISGNKTFFYNSNNEVEIITKKEKDTFFVYYDTDFDKPATYELRDKKGITEQVDLFSGIKKEYKERTFDKNESLTYYVLNQTYIPTEFDKKHLSSGERLKKESEYLKSTIVEIEYEYYEK